MARTDEGHELTNLELEKLKIRIDKIYRAASDDVQKQAEEYFAKFYEKRDLKMLEELNKGNITDKQYKEWRLAQIGRGKRMETLASNLAKRMNAADEEAIRYVNAAMPSVYALNRNYAAYVIEQAGNNIDFSLWDESTVKRLIKQQPDLMPHYPINRAINRNINLAYGKSQITKCVTAGILRGSSLTDVAKDLQGKVQTMSKGSAMRAARTAMTAAENAGREDEFIDAANQGIDMEQEWMATRDERTRDSHADLDGEHVPIGKKFSNGCRYPGDSQGRPGEVYNCRCTLVAWFPELAEENSKRYKYSEWKEGKSSAQYTIGEKSTIDRETINEYAAPFLDDSDIKEDTTYKYHATTEKAVKGIIKKGLLPNRGHLGKGVYFAVSEKDALEWTRETSTAGTTLLRVKESALNSLGYYEEYDENESGYGMAEGLINETIPIEFIEIYDDYFGWESLAKNAKRRILLFKSLPESVQKEINRILGE